MIRTISKVPSNSCGNNNNNNNDNNDNNNNNNNNNKYNIKQDKRQSIEVKK